MRILLINVVCGIRSTGRICTDLAVALEMQGHEVKIAYGREEVPEKFQKFAERIGTSFDVKIHGIKARLTDGCGYGSKRATKKFIEWVKDYNPDVIHLHNLHGYYINLEELFDYLCTCGKKIIWTLHDCWAFTGHAAYCETANCEKWITGCHDCPKISDYPSSLVDHSKDNWEYKRLLLSNVPNMTIVTPSEWLANLVKKSFLSHYPVIVIHNGIDTSVFKPIKSNIKQDLGIENKEMILGVAAEWNKRKGLLDFIKLGSILPDNYKIVLVGLSKKQMKRLPKEIIGIERTDTVHKLAELYSAANVFVNPTYEENYPATNLEAISCGTPVITYKTGGSPESAQDYGMVISKGNIKELRDCIISINKIDNTFPDYNSTKTAIEYMELYGCL